MCKVTVGKLTIEFKPLMPILFTFTAAEERALLKQRVKKHKQMLRKYFRLIKTLLSIGMREQTNNDSVEVNESLHIEESPWKLKQHW